MFISTVKKGVVKMRVNILTYTGRDYSGLNYAYAILTQRYSLEDIKKDGRPIVLWAAAESSFVVRCALEKADLSVKYVCDPYEQTQIGDIKSKEMIMKDYRTVLNNADDYFHIIYYDDYFCWDSRMKDSVKRLQYRGVREMGIVFYGDVNDFAGHKNLQDAVYETIYEIWGESELLNNWKKMENCSRTALSGTTYWGVGYMMIYKLFRKSKDVKLLDVGPGVGTMTLSLKKLMDIDVTWLVYPQVKEDMWLELESEATEQNKKKYNIKTMEGFLELDDFSQMNNQYDVIVFTQVMEHLIYNPVNTINKLKNMLKEDGYLYIAVPGKIKRYHVEHYSEMPYPNELSSKEQEERSMINEMHHFREYSKEEALEVFEEVGLECILYTEGHHFILQKKESSKK